MASDRNVAPVIIKKEKFVVEDGHHGGAWKVAYADFVTAMMAFFMLMWLLNATTEKQRKGIADYFSPVAPISRMSSGSDGMFTGDSVFAEDVLPQMGVGASSLHKSADDAGEGGTDPTAEETEQNSVFEEIEQVLLGLRGESMVDDNWLRHMISVVTDEGLVLEFHDLPDAPLFDDKGQPTDALRGIAYAVREAAREHHHDIAVQAHVATPPLVQRNDTTWERSSQHAFEMADLIVHFGLVEDRLRRVTAYGNKEPVEHDTMSIRNNRIEVIFLRR